MRLPLRSIPDHTKPFPFRSRTGQLHQLGPKYMAKRPLLTIQIPSGIERVERYDRVHEVSCFSPFTPDDESCDTESIASPSDDKCEEDGVVAQQVQSMSNVSRDGIDENQISMVRIGSRWSRRYQRNSLQEMINQVYSTPTRRYKRISAHSGLPLSWVGSDSHRCSPSQRIVQSERRRKSNPLDCFSSHRSSKMSSPRNLDKTNTQYSPFPTMNSPCTALDKLITPKALVASSLRNLGASSLRSDRC